MIVRTQAGQLVPITAGDVYFGEAASAEPDSKRAT
jgi:hypothetical protein